MADISLAPIAGAYNGTDLASYTLASGTPVANRLQLLLVGSSRATSDPSVPVISGNGLTWELVRSRLYRSGTSSNYRASLFRACGSGAVTGTPVVDFAPSGGPGTGTETQSSLIYGWSEASGDVDVSGANGVNAIVQSVDNAGTGTPGGPATATLAAFNDIVRNAAYFAAFVRDNTNATPEVISPVWTELDDDLGSTPVHGLSAMWRLGGSDLTPSTAFDSLTSSDWCAIAVEIKAITSSVQKLYVTADSVDNGYTTDTGGATLFEAINESGTPSDADFIQSSLTPSNLVTRLKVDPAAADPALSTGHIVRWRPSKDITGGGNVDMKIALRQGGADVLGAGTLIAEFTRTNVATGFNTFEETLSGVQADAITNYADLYVEFTSNQV